MKKNSFVSRFEDSDEESDRKKKRECLWKNIGLTEVEMDIIGYRYVILENKIQEILQRIKDGDTEFEVDAGDLTDSEILYVKNEIEKRLS